MSNPSALNNQLEILKEIEKSIDECDNKLSELTSIEGIQDSLNTKIDPKSRADINWTCAYGVYTSYYMYLLLNETQPKNHKISDEIQRLQIFKQKINEAYQQGKDRKQTKELTNEEKREMYYKQITTKLNRADTKY